MQCKKSIKKKRRWFIYIKRKNEKSDKDIKEYEKNKKHIGELPQIIIIIIQTEIK